ncbi:thiamine transporter 1-like isoform X2 [Onthophagus taurus]|uniref:thiamine transporter 1-like isoform X2 n=1 Tax=Onthophagus taurus TaxID=166361 RepID=UPI000C20E1EE|nr:thiamine transporter 1-like [Onthophagus taurus]
MQSWLKISLLLCVFGFLKELRPSEPFIYEFLIGEWRNVTPEEVAQHVYPVGTYSYLAQLVIVFLITDLSRYKPLIIVSGISGLIVWGMLLWTKTLLELQILEIFYGTFMATEVAYYTYIYAKVPTEFYQQVTSHTRAALLVGRALSGFLAQILVSFDAMDYRELNYITFAALIAATIWAIFLPSVQKSIYFHRMQEENQHLTASKYKTAFSLMKKHFIDSFSNKYVLRWSIWWALATAGFIQVQVYIQPLWSEIQKESNSDEENFNIYNGAVEAILTIIGALGALGAGFIKTDWKHKGELMLCVCSLFGGAFILICSQTTSVVVSYVCYVLFGGLYHFMITIASAEIAKFIMEDSYGLVFGLNTLVALTCQTFLTLCFVTGDLGLALSPRDQYLVYGIYHIIISALYIVIGLTAWMRSNRDIQKTYT